MRHVIIGNSAAGVYAAEAIRAVDSKCKITIISDEKSPCYSRCLLPYYISGELSQEELIVRDIEWYRSRDIETLLGKRAIKVAEDARKVILDDDEEIPYGSLLVATGGSARLPPVDGIDNPMVFTLRDMDDALRISEVLPGAKQAVVLGAGLIGLKVVYALWSRGVSVTVVEVLGHVLPQTLDLRAAEIVQKALGQQNIVVKTGSTATRIIGRESTVEAIELDSGETITCDLVVCAVGVRPNTELVQDTAIQRNEGILVDEHMRTNVPDVYAAGDVAETIDFLSKERRVNAVWPSATRGGKIAGCNMAGVDKRCDAEMAMNSLDFFGIPIISIGLVDPEGDEYETITAHSPEKSSYRKLVLKGGRIVGMVLVGDVKKAGVISSLIRREDDVTQIVCAFSEGEVFKHSFVTDAFSKTLHYPARLG